MELCVYEKVFGGLEGRFRDKIKSFTDNIYDIKTTGGYTYGF